MAHEHDLRYKKLFSNPKLVEELLTSFVHEDFISKIDFSTLEQVNKSFVTAKYKSKESDIIYKVQFNEGNDVFIYLLLEFQSTVDKYMALRMLRYICELYEFLLNERKNSRFMKLPAVLPVMLYNGDDVWSAATSMHELIEPSLPSKLLPQLTYIKIAENEYEESELLEIKNAVAALFYTENLGIEEMAKKLDNLFKIIADENQDVVEHFFSWLLNFLKNNDIILESVEEQISNLSERKDMLATSIQRSKRNWIKIGEERGVRLGEERGLKLGEERGLKLGEEHGSLNATIDNVLCILKLRFKTVPNNLESEIRRCSDLEKLRNALQSAATANELDEFKF